MTACIHGEICREYLRQRRGIICQTCPTGCRFYEPEERTCHMVFDHMTDTAFCDVCGERFDGVAQYMAMVPNGFSVADYKEKYKDAKFCPNCGARVIQE